MKFAYLIEPPFNHRAPDGVVTGTDVELARVAVQELGLGAFEPVETEFAELLPGVAEGRWRMTTGLFATEERRQQALFSDPIWALPDGLLVSGGNPKGLSGYESIASQDGCILAVIRDQIQHRSAIEFGVSDASLRVFETYTDAADAVLAGAVDAYASVARAHHGFIDLAQDNRLDVTTVPAEEKQPAYGSFAFGKADDSLCEDVNRFLRAYLGSSEHRQMMHIFGFTDYEIDLVLSRDD